MKMKLCDLKPKENGCVKGLEASGVIRRRLLDLGLVQGTKVTVLRRSPLGDPSLYNIRGAMIALRKEEAELVIMERGVKHC